MAMNKVSSAWSVDLAENTRELIEARRRIRGLRNKNAGSRQSDTTEGACRYVEVDSQICLSLEACSLKHTGVVCARRLRNV